MGDGKNIERFWFVLGKLTYITREMLGTNRQDLLVDTMLHIGQKALANTTATLVSCLKHAKAQKTKVEADLLDQCDKVRGKLCN